MFNIHQSVAGKDGDLNERRVEKYIEGVTAEFGKSPEAQAYLEKHGEIGWTGIMLDYAFNYPGVNIPEMRLADFHEVLFELFPRKVSVKPEAAGEIIAELRAFWTFIDRQYQLPNARQILGSLTEKAEHRLQKELSNPANFGMAKSFFTMGEQSGFDMSSQEGLNAFMNAYNSSRMAQLMGGMPPLGPPGFDEDEDDDVLYDDEEPLPGPRKPVDKDKKRKERKAKRQARKRNRR